MTATIYIATTGSDTLGNGSELLPYKTPSKAGSVANPGDTILARGGTYTYSGEHDFDLIGSSTDSIIFTAYPGEDPIFEASGTFGSNDAIWSLGHSSQYCTISSMELRNNNSGSNVGRGLEIESSISPKANHITIQDMVVHNVAERGIGGGGNNVTVTGCEVYDFAMSNENEAFGGVGGWATGIASFSYSDNSLPTDWIVTECYVHHGWGEGINILRVTGFTCTNNTVETVYSVTVYPDKAQDVTISGNELAFDDITYRKNGRNAHGITLSGEGTPMHSGTHEIDNITITNNEIKGMENGISWFQDTNHVKNSYRNVLVYHNSLYSCTKALNFAAVAALAPAPSGNIAKNNIFDGAMTTNSNPTTWTFTHNCWIDGIPALGTHTNSFHDNPDYTAATTSIDSTLEIDGTSPCIGTGTYLASVPTDKDGATRPNPPTIGAYEQTASAPASDAVYAYATSFLTGTGAAASTVTVSGIVNDAGASFTPVAAIFYWSGRTEAVDTVGARSVARGIGFATSASDFLAVTTFALHNSANSDTGERKTLAACVSILDDAAGAARGELKLQSFGSGSMVLEVVNQFDTSYRIHCVLIGGAGLTGASTFSFSAATATGVAASLAGLSFQPTSLILASTSSATAPPSTGVDSRFMIGLVDSALNQAVWCGGGDDAAAAANTLSYIRHGECIALTNASLTSTTLRATATAYNSDGASFNYTEVSGTASVIYGLALRGGLTQVGDFLTQTDTTTVVTETLTFDPVGGLFVSASRAESTSDTATDHDQLSLGGWANGGPGITQHAIGVLDVDAADPTVTVAGIEFDNVYANVKSDGTLQGSGMVQSVSDTAMEFIMTAADPAQSFVFYWLIGNTPEVITPPGASTPVDDRIYVYRRRFKH